MQLKDLHRNIINRVEINMGAYFFSSDFFYFCDYRFYCSSF